VQRRTSPTGGDPPLDNQLPIKGDTVERLKGNVMSEVRNNGSVKWWHLISILIPMFFAPLGYTYTVSNDSVNRHEFNQFEKRIEDKFRSIEKHLDIRFGQIDNKFDNLELILRDMKMDLREIKNSGERKS